MTFFKYIFHFKEIKAISSHKQVDFCHVSQSAIALAYALAKQVLWV